MANIGEDKTQKLNNSLIGADSSWSNDAKSAEAKLRESFARELSKAEARAEERIIELNYAASVRNKLKRKASSSSPREKEEKQKLENDDVKAKDERLSALKKELDEIEARRLRREALLLSLSKKSEDSCDASSAPAPREENIETAEGVSQNSEKTASETVTESKVSLTKSARFKLVKPTGINIKIVPVFHGRVFIHPQDAGHSPEIRSFIMRPMQAAEAEDLTFGEVGAPFDAENNDGISLDSVGAAFIGASIPRAVRYPYFHRESFESDGEESGDIASFEPETFTDADHAAHTYPDMTDADHVTHTYPDMTDADHAAHTYPDFTDADHVAHTYPDMTDADHAAHTYPDMTDADHVTHTYPDMTDADHVTHTYSDFTDADHVAHTYPDFTDADHAATEFERYTDADHASVDFDGFTDEFSDFPVDYDESAEHYGLISESYEDAKAIAAYEAMHIRRGKMESLFSGYEIYQNENDFSTHAAPLFDEAAVAALDFSVYGRRELLKYLREGDGRVKDFERAVLKTQKSMKKLSVEDKTKALLDTVNLNKHIVDLRAMALYAVVSADFAKEKKYRKRLLTDAINEYNSVLSDYEARTGESFKKASLSLPGEIASGAKYTPIALIAYRGEGEIIIPQYDGEEFSFVYSQKASRREKRREQLRFLREAKREEKRIASFVGRNRKKPSKNGEELLKYREKIERNTEFFKTRSEALRINLESELDYLDYSFNPSYREKERERRAIKEKIRKLKKERKRELKYEKLDSERYYSQLLVSADSLGITKRSKIDKLDSLAMSLDALLSERERINEQLIKLYSGDIRGGGDGKLNQRLRKIKRRAARKTSAVFRSEMRVIGERVPLDIKEKLARCVNKIIDAEMLIATLKYKLRKTKPRGEAKRDMKLKISENRKSIKRYLADYRRFLKKAKHYAVVARSLKFQLAWILLTLAALVTLAVFYLRYEAPVNEFFRKAYLYLKSVL